MSESKLDLFFSSQN